MGTLHKYVVNKAYQVTLCRSIMTIYILPVMQNVDMEEFLFIQLYSQLHATNKPETSIQIQKNNQ
jgi:hypothetical protein